MQKVRCLQFLHLSFCESAPSPFLRLLPRNAFAVFAGLLSIAISENLQNELVSQLYKDSAMGEMMRETPDVARRRGEIQEMRGLLQRALNIVNEVRDFNTFVPGAK